MAPIATLTARISAQMAEFQKAFQDSTRVAQKFANDFQGAATKAAAVGSFFGTIAADLAKSIAQGFGRAISDAVRLSSQMTNSLIGLGSVARAFGIDANKARDAARSLSADGLMPLADSATSLKNLLAAGFNLDQSINLINAFKDSAAFGRQSAMSFGDAVRSATEGVKNGNSILVDNAGVTKNLSQILKEAGFSAQDLSKASSDVSVRLALYNGIIKETRAQTGDAAKLTQTYSGQVSRLSSQYDMFLATLGTAITQNKSVAIAIGAVGDVFQSLTDLLVNNRNGFNLVSDAVLILARSFSLAISVVDLMQSSLNALSKLMTDTAKLFVDVGTAAFKFTEQASSVLRFLDPQNFQRHTDAMLGSKAAYGQLALAAASLSVVSRDATDRSLAWGTALQGVQTKVNALSSELRESRGRTVELGEAAGKTGSALGGVGDGAAAADKWVKALGKSMDVLESELLAAETAGVPMTTVLEEFGTQIEKVVNRAPMIGKAIGEATKRAAAALKEADFQKAFAEMMDDANDEARKLTKAMEKEGREAGDKFFGALAKRNKEFVREFSDLQRSLMMLQEDGLDRRLALINLEYDEQQSNLDQTSTLYQRHYDILEAQRQQALGEAVDDWEAHGDTIENALSGVFRDIAQVTDGWVSSLLGGLSAIMGAVGKLGSMAKASLTDKLSFIGQGIGSVISATASGGTASRVIGGAATGAVLGAGATAALGAKAGAFAGPWGAVIGAGVGALVGWFRARSAAKQAEKEANASLDKMRQDLVAVFGSIDNLARVGEAIGVNLGAVWGEKGAKGLERFGVVAEQFKDKIDGLNEELAKIGSRGGVASKELLKFRDAMRDSAEVAQFIQEETMAAAAGVEAFLKSATIATAEGAAALGGVLAGAFAQLQKQGVSPREALLALQGPIAALQEQLQKTGFTGGAAFEYINHLAVIAANEISGPAIDAVAGLTAALQGAFNAGFLTQDMFSGLVAEILRQRQAIIDTGVASDTANQLTQQGLQTIWQLTKDYGFAVDEVTQQLLDQAEAAGTVGDQFRTAADRTARALERVATALEKLVGGTDELSDSLNKIPKEINVDVKMRETREAYIDPGVYAGGLDQVVPAFARGSGGFRNFGRGTLAMLHGVEAVVRPGETVGTSPMVVNLSADFSGAYIDNERTADRLVKKLFEKIRSGGTSLSEFQSMVDMAKLRGRA